MPAIVPNEAQGPAVPDGPSLWRQIAALIGFLALSWVVSFVGSLPIRTAAGGWYALADKAPWTPPGLMFTSVWLVLYAAMAVAAWLVWRQRREPRRRALTLYGLQLALNLVWPMTFFGLYPVLGTAALWLALVFLTAVILTASLTVLRFGPISQRPDC